MVYSRCHFQLPEIRKILSNETMSVLGYGPQGRNQSLNLLDRGFNVVLGLRPGNSWNQAIQDGWVPRYNLFSIEEAVQKGTIIQYLLSDAGQMQTWSQVKSNLRPNSALYFSHGFSIVYGQQTGIHPPSNVDVIMVAPKSPGAMLRQKYLADPDHGGVNVSWAVYQDVTGRAKERAIFMAFAIGALNTFETTFERETYSDLTGERCVLLGLIQGAFKAQFDVLIENGHSPLESFCETVEEALQTLYPLMNDKGVDWMYRNCSTTAQRGAIDWSKRFEAVLKPLIQECYDRVKNGSETRRVIEANSDPEYRKRLDQELAEIDQQTLWEAGRAVRQLRK